MRHRRILALSGLVWALAAAPGEAAKLRGVAAASEPAYVAVVEIVASETKLPAGFGEALQAEVLRQSALYGVTGQPLTLKITLDKVHIKNPVQALLIGDDNATKGAVEVMGPAAALGRFKVRVNADRGGELGLSIGMMLVGALDPTGAIDMATTLGQAGSGVANRSGVETAMTRNFAREALRQTFGEVRAKAVRSQKPVAAPAPAPAAAPGPAIEPAPEPVAAPAPAAAPVEADPAPPPEAAP